MDEESTCKGILGIEAGLFHRHSSSKVSSRLWQREIVRFGLKSVVRSTAAAVIYIDKIL
jgi:hypothetical protein